MSYSMFRNTYIRSQSVLIFNRVCGARFGKNVILKYKILENSFGKKHTFNFQCNLYVYFQYIYTIVKFAS